MAIEASIAHSSRKLNNAQKLQEQVSKDVERQDTKVRGYQGDLQSVQKAANEAQGKWQAYAHASFFANSVTEVQRRASQSNLSLSEGSLEEYRRLFVCFIFLMVRTHVWDFLERHGPAFSLLRNVNLLTGSRGKKRLRHERLPSLETDRRNSSRGKQVCARITMYMKRRNPMCVCLCVRIEDVSLIHSPLSWKTRSRRTASS